MLMPLTALTVLDATAFELGLVAAASYVAWIVIGLPAGVLVQRLPLRGAQVGADLARAVAVGSVPLAWWWGHLTIAQLIVTALVVSFANVVFDPGAADRWPPVRAMIREGWRFVSRHAVIGPAMWAAIS
nr:hypothetical protein [Micromonospora pisi]